MHGRPTSRPVQVALAMIVAGALVAGGARVVAAQAPVPQPLLPDLRAQIPTHLALRVVDVHGTAHVQLRFRSAVENVGAGPLVILGKRRRHTRTMRADQLVARSDGTIVVGRRIGEMRYVRSHRHWHIEHFVAYALRTAGTLRLVRRGPKQDWCLRDARDLDSRTQAPGEPAKAVFTGHCGRGLPFLRALNQGLSVGFGDFASSGVRGQDVDITTLPSGRYWLVHRVDPRGHLLQTTRSDDAAALLLQITWRTIAPGRRRVTVRPLRACPTSSHCATGVPPGGVARVAAAG